MYLQTILIKFNVRKMYYKGVLKVHKVNFVINFVAVFEGYYICTILQIGRMNTDRKRLCDTVCLMHGGSADLWCCEYSLEGQATR